MIGGEERMNLIGIRTKTSCALWSIVSKDSVFGELFEGVKN